jgi:hypothetical protein
MGRIMATLKVYAIESLDNVQEQLKGEERDYNSSSLN